MRELASRHGVRPSKALGQNFLIDPNLARMIASTSGVGPTDRVLEIGAGLGSLTTALASTGAEVIAVEFDRGLVAALREVIAELDRVDVVEADAMKIYWPALLSSGGRRAEDGGDGEAHEGDEGLAPPWHMVSNLPYNIATPLLLDMLTAGLPFATYLVMVQREAGERLAAGPGDDAYGAVSVRVAYLADAAVVRRIPSTVFWPKPDVDSVLVRLVPHAEPPVATDRGLLFGLIEEGFAQRRKTMANALRRTGLTPEQAQAAITEAGLSPSIRAEELSLRDFAELAEAVPPHG